MCPILLRVAEWARLEDEGCSTSRLGGVMSRAVSGTSCCGLCWCSRLTGVGERLRLGVVDLRRCCVRWMMRTSDGSGP